MKKANHGHNALPSATIGDNNTRKAMRFPCSFERARSQGPRRTASRMDLSFPL